MPTNDALPQKDDMYVQVTTSKKGISIGKNKKRISSVLFESLSAFVSAWNKSGRVVDRRHIISTAAVKYTLVYKFKMWNMTLLGWSSRDKIKNN